MNYDNVLIYLPIQDMHLVPDVVFEIGWGGFTREELAKIFKDHSYMYILYSTSTNTLSISFTYNINRGISFHTQEAKDILFSILLEI